MNDVVYDPYDRAFHEDPDPTYATLREEAPSIITRRLTSLRCPVGAFARMPIAFSPGRRVAAAGAS